MLGSREIVVVPPLVVAAAASSRAGVPIRTSVSSDATPTNAETLDRLTAPRPPLGAVLAIGFRREIHWGRLLGRLGARTAWLRREVDEVTCRITIRIAGWLTGGVRRRNNDGRRRRFEPLDPRIRAAGEQDQHEGHEDERGTPADGDRLGGGLEHLLVDPQGQIVLPAVERVPVVVGVPTGREQHFGRLPGRAGNAEKGRSDQADARRGQNDAQDDPPLAVHPGRGPPRAANRARS